MTVQRSGTRQALGGGARYGNILSFNPTSLITGAGGFWRADIGVTGGATVTAWADQSSFANNLSVAGGQSSPSSSSTAFNSAKPGVIVADNTTQGLGLTFDFGGSSTMTAFWLMQYASGNSLGHGRFIALIAHGDANDFAGAKSFETDDGASENSFSWFANSAERGNGGSTGPTLTGTNLYLLGVSYDGTNFHKWTAGAELGTQTTAVMTFGTSGLGGDLFTFGRSQTSSCGGTTYAFIGFTQKSMSTTDWTNLKTWTNSNWGTSF